MKIFSRDHTNTNDTKKQGHGIAIAECRMGERKKLKILETFAADH